MRVLGIDSGINGAAALYCGGCAEPTVPNGVFDIPTVGESKQREIDYAGFRDLIWAVKADVVFIELINAFVPKDEETGEAVRWGGTSMLKFGGAYYAAKAVCACLDLPPRAVTASSWKKFFGLKGGAANKDHSRQLVLQRFPLMQPYMRRIKDGHRAEAFLIAVYGYALLTGQTRGASAKKFEEPAFVLKPRFAGDEDEIPE